MKKTIPFLTLERQHKEIKKELQDALLNTLDSNNFILGENLKLFEKEFAAFSNSNYCLGVGNGFDALKLSLKALGIGIGDEVITPAHTFIATILAIQEVGATPILVDANPLTYNIDEMKIGSKITSKTKAIIVVHLYGLPCNMEPILKLSTKYTIPIIEDNAQAQGATFKGIPTGSFGKLSATSFYPAKNLGALGDGGAITTNDISLFSLIEKFRNYGSKEKYINVVSGCNSRLDEIQAKVLSIKLKHLAKWNNERRKIANHYKILLKNTPIQLQETTNEDYKSVYHIFTIKTDDRTELMEYLNDKGIKTQIHYPIPPHLQECCSSLGYKKGDFPITENLSESLLSLPLFIGMTIDEIQYVSNSIIAFYKNK